MGIQDYKSKHVPFGYCLLVNNSAHSIDINNSLYQHIYNYHILQAKQILEFLMVGGQFCEVYYKYSTL